MSMGKMDDFWDRILKLDDEKSRWIEEDELGGEKLITHRGKDYLVKIPPVMNKKKTLRLRGLGKRFLRKRGDLYLHLWLNRGEDAEIGVWISERAAREGAQVKLHTGDKMIEMTVPPNSREGLKIRLKGLGKGPARDYRAPYTSFIKRGNLLVRLYLYPDRVAPRYGSFDHLSTENMALEGWVYLKFDEVMGKLDPSVFPDRPIPADKVAELYNTGGLRYIFPALRKHFGLNQFDIRYTVSDSIVQPGACKRTTETKDGVYINTYVITLNPRFVKDPFAITAILAHEMGHVLYHEKVLGAQNFSVYGRKTESASLEEERMVDLLVFMYRMGEFQLRVSRDTRLTLGYFNQEIFERMQVIVSRKLGWV